MIRWWPPVALSAMVVLGLVVGKGSTALDDWFLQFHVGATKWLLPFSDPLVYAFLMGATISAPLARRQWRLAGIAAVSPLIAWGAVQLLKMLFDRQKDSFLAYPSGHATLAVVYWGMVVLVAGAATWSVWAAVTFSALAMLGQACVWHYFTDTVGGALLGTSVVCLATLAARAKLTRVKPDAICVTNSG